MTTRRRPLWLPVPEDVPDSFDPLREAAAHLSPMWPGPAHPLADAREADYDRYFGIARTPHRPADTLAQALYSAVGEMTALAPQEAHPALHRSLAVCGLATPKASGCPDDSLLGRWKTGHRLFFALIQCAIVALHSATPDAGADAAQHPAPGDTHSAAMLLKSCATVMRATASFSPYAYTRVVRPSMAPPQHDLDGFSGLWSADHRVLVSHLRTWGTAHSRSCSRRCPPHQELSAALAEVHDAHHGICARYVGAQPSLLGGDDNALHTLTQLNTRRSHLLRPPARP